MPSPLEAKIQSDMTDALKKRESVRLSVLRMLKSAIQVASTEKGRVGDVADEEIHAIIRRAIKQRDEAAQHYRAGRADSRAEEELAEAEILREYLPAQLDDDELRLIVQTVTSDLGATDKRDMGRVMSEAVRRVQGRADGKRVRDFVVELL